MPISRSINAFGFLVYIFKTVVLYEDTYFYSSPYVRLLFFSTVYLCLLLFPPFCSALNFFALFFLLSFNIVLAFKARRVFSGEFLHLLLGAACRAYLV